MTSTAAAVPAAVAPPHYAQAHDHEPPAEYALPASLIATRPILPLPKRRLPSSSSTATNPPQSSSTPSPSSTTNGPSTSPTQPQIFSHTYPLAVSSSPNANGSLLPPYLPTDAEDSESDDDDAYSSGWTFSREDFNTSNKKKRKIPLSATSSAPLGSVTVDGSIVSSPGSGTRVLGSKTGPSSGTATGRLAGWRVPSATMRSEGGYLRRTKARRSVEPEETVNGVVPGMVGSVPSTPEMPAAGNEEDTSRTSPAPSGPFSFSCPSPLSAPLASMVPPSLKSTSTANGGGTYVGQPSAPPTAPLPVPPPPPPAAVDPATQQQAYTQTAQVSAQTQTTANPQAPAQPGPPAQQGQQQQQQRIPTQGIKHPNSEKARRVAQLTKLRERWRTGPKPEPDEIYICPFCTYGFIYGEDPVYLVRQYNRKRFAEIRARRERRKMLEKARMKGKKGTATQPTQPAQPTAAPTNPPAQQGVEDVEGAEDDGLCCTCGQKVGGHSHVESVQTAKGVARGDPGPGRVRM